MLPVPNLLAPLMWHERRAHLQRNVEALTLAGSDLGNAESALEDLLARAAAEIDTWLARNRFQ
jgi:hypothetical protein